MKVKVYRYTGWSHQQGANISPRAKAILAFIERYNLRPIMESEEEVPTEHLDGNGQYKPPT